jgi:hypothetical protein
MPGVGELELPSGRTIHLQELRQYRTYEGLLEGLPTLERNREGVERLVAQHGGFRFSGRPYLVAPRETPLEYHGGRPYPFGTPSALPGVTCIGRFESGQPARDRARDYSRLVVIWFQEEFAFPIAPSVVAELLTIDWAEHATDDDY